MSSRGGIGRVSGVACLLLVAECSRLANRWDAGPAPPEQAGAVAGGGLAPLPGELSALGRRPLAALRRAASRSGPMRSAEDVRQSGYQAEVVDNATPVPQFYPDAADTSASDYYPTSNWAADYNHYMVPGGELRLRLVRRLEPLVPAPRLPELRGEQRPLLAQRLVAGGRLERGAGERGVWLGRRLEQQPSQLERQPRRPRLAPREPRAARRRRAPRLRPHTG